MSATSRIPGSHGSAPGRRAVVRWAWRLFRREWRQQLLVLALITLSVAAAATGGAVAVNGGSTVGSEFGTAGAMIHLDATDAASARAAVAAARRRFGRLEVVAHQTIPVPGASERLDVRAQDPHGFYAHPLLALRHGRYPKGAGEVALTAGAARLLATSVGQHVTLGRVQKTVVGVVEDPTHLNDDFALLAPGVGTADSLTLFIADPRTRARPTGGQPQVDLPVMVRPQEGGAASVAVLVAITLAMVLVGLVASAGFVVVAQRRQRQLGLLAALGATERQIRLVVVANGAIVGVAAAVVGGILGVAGWIAAAPALETAVAHRIDRFDLPWSLILATMLLAVAMATGAAWWPARTLGRLPVMRALSGRPSLPRPVHRSLLVALALMVVGVAGIAAADPTGDVRGLPLIGGILAVVIGVVFAAPAAIRAAAAPAAHFPFATRLALRDLARYQARAAAAVAAVAIGLAIAVIVVVLAQANEYRSDEGNLSSSQLVLREQQIGDAPTVDLGAADRRQRMDAAAAQVAATLDHPAVYPLDVALPRTKTSGPFTVDVAHRLDAHSYRHVDEPFIATPALLRRYGIDPATVDDATDLLTVHDEALVLLDPSIRSDWPTRIQREPLSNFTSAPASLVTPSAVRRHGWRSARAAYLIESTRPLTTDEVVAARAAAARAGFSVEARSGQDDLAALRTGATATGAVLALAIVAMTIGLIRGEAARDLRTLTATGASARTRRAITASTAGVVAFAGVVLGTAGAYLALVASYHSDLGELSSPPVTQLALLLVALPLVAATAGWALAGREPHSFARQALD